MALRRFPGIGPGPNGAAGAEVLQLVGTPWHVTKAEFYAADAASMELFRSEEDPIGELLPVNSVLGAFILRGDMHTNAEEWVLLEDLKKTTRSNQTALISRWYPLAGGIWSPMRLGFRRYRCTVGQPGEDYFASVAARGPGEWARAGVGEADGDRREHDDGKHTRADECSGVLGQHHARFQTDFGQRDQQRQGGRGEQHHLDPPTHGRSCR